jgi:hypothetical protein
MSVAAETASSGRVMIEETSALITLSATEVVAQIVGEIDRSHAAPAEHALEHVPVAQGGRDERRIDCGHEGARWVTLECALFTRRMPAIRHSG